MTAVTHDSSGRRFVAVLDAASGAEAVLDYRVVDEGTLEYHHTFVPHAFRGRGVAAALAKAALDHARERGMRVIPSCWYVRRYVDRYPEYRSIASEPPGGRSRA